MIVHADTPQDAVAAIRAHIDATRKALLAKCGPAEASGSTGGRILALGDLLAELSDVVVLRVPMSDGGNPWQDMASAPKDGTVIEKETHVVEVDRIRCKWNGDAWLWVGGPATPLDADEHVLQRWRNVECP